MVAVTVIWTDVIAGPPLITALMFVLPSSAALVARPVELLIVAIVVLEDVHTALAVKSLVEPSV